MASPRVFLAALPLAFALLSGCASTRPTRVALAAVPSAPELRPALPPGEDSALGLYLAAETALEASESDAAAELFARASLANPGDLGVRERAFSTNLLAGHVDVAARFAPEPPAEAQALTLGRLVKGVDDLAAGRGEAARALLAPADLTGPHAAAAALVLPWAEAAAGAKPSPAHPAATGRAPRDGRFAALGRARLLERAGEAAAAEPLFKAWAADKDPLFALAYGGFLERRRRLADAVVVYDAVLKVEADSAVRAARVRAAAGGPAPRQPTPQEAAAEALIGPAAALINARRADLGLIYARLALRLDPRLDSGWLVVGDTLTAAGETAAARAAYAHIPEASPEGADALERLALAAQSDGDKAEALRLARRAVALAPEDDQPGVVLAEVLRAQNDNEGAVAVLDPLVARAGASPRAARLLFMRGAAHERAGRWPAAEADLQRSLEIQPDDAEVLNYLAFGWADRSLHLKEALGMLERAAAAKPDAGSVLDSVGWARFRMGDLKGALRDLEKAVALEPADPEINDHLGDLYARLGRKAEASYQWRRVLTLEPEDKVRLSAEAKLKAVEPLHTGDAGAARAPSRTARTRTPAA